MIIEKLLWKHISGSVVIHCHSIVIQLSFNCHSIVIQLSFNCHWELGIGHLSSAISHVAGKLLNRDNL